MRRFLDIVLRQADRLNAIIEDLLSLSRIERESEAGEVTLSLRNVRSVIESAVQTCSIEAEQKGIDIEIHCEDDLRARISPPLIEQALVNLLVNAIRYSEPDETVAVGAEAESPSAIVLYVRDHGCGIAKEHLPRLFERFYRVDKARSRKLGGTGLGLSIVKNIAVAHGGCISVESEIGVGSTFTLMLPASPRAAAV
jgi:two-component system phosphate regulon sensor histidine kinase PhoR